MLAACGQSPSATSNNSSNGASQLTTGNNTTPANQAAPGTKLKVVATTTIVGDVVEQIGGDLIDLTVLMQPGVDPHSFEFTPQDVAKVAESDVVFVNGAGLEEFMSSLIQNAGTNVNVVTVSQGVTLLRFGNGHDEHNDATPVAEAAQSSDEHEHAGSDDPHVWWNPQNVIIWTDNIARALGEKDAAHAEAFAANAAAYKTQLQELDSWIVKEVQRIPEGKRKLVTDHDTFGYLANRYGFELVGEVIPNLSTQSEPSAQELAALQEAIKTYHVKAVFVGTTVNPSLSQRVTEDTGTKLVTTYTDSLGEPGSEAGTYLDFMRTSITTIVNALV